MRSEIIDNHVIVHAVVNSAYEGRFLLDTGAGMSYLPIEDLASLGIREDDPHVSVHYSSSLGGRYKVMKTRLISFSLGPGLIPQMSLSLNGSSAGY